jgi:hypothetical protein
MMFQIQIIQLDMIMIAATTVCCLLLQSVLCNSFNSIIAHLYEAAALQKAAAAEMLPLLVQLLVAVRQLCQLV